MKIGKASFGDVADRPIVATIGNLDVLDRELQP